MTSRRRARGIALQILYELDCTHHQAKEVLARLVYDESIDESTYVFIEALVGGVQTYQRQIDSIIEQYAPAFPVAQLAPIDRTILRIGLYEIVFAPEVSVKVSINEAVELAKTFGGESSPRLVNGVLGAVADREKPGTSEENA
jgi:N utilization substance protein B